MSQTGIENEVIQWSSDHVFYNGEFDPGSERTLAARFKHASRAGSCSNTSESGGRVSNTWIIWPTVWDSLVKAKIIPDTTVETQVLIFHLKPESWN